LNNDLHQLNHKSKAIKFLYLKFLEVLLHFSDLKKIFFSFGISDPLSVLRQLRFLGGQLGPEGLGLHTILSFVDAEADGLLVQPILDQQLEDGL
jgi:hypothetical protein